MRAMPIVIAAACIAGCAHYEIVGYYAGWKEQARFSPRDVTVLDYAFADICWEGRHGHPVEGGLKPCLDADGSPARPPDGSIVLDDPVKEAATFARLVALKDENPRLKLMLSVGGWTRSNRFSDMASDAAARASFVDSTIAFLRRHRFDGIDLDWEYPTDIGVPCTPDQTCQRREDKRNFVVLAKELRAALDSAGRADVKRYLFTIAAGADYKFLLDPDGSSAWLAELAQSVDWINLMSYDYHGSWELAAGFNAPLDR